MAHGRTRMGDCLFQGCSVEEDMWLWLYLAWVAHLANASGAIWFSMCVGGAGIPWAASN
jgi:hypothetical protein